MGAGEEVNIQKKFEDPEMQRAYEENIRERSTRTPAEVEEDLLIENTERLMLGITRFTPLSKLKPGEYKPGDPPPRKP